MQHYLGVGGLAALAYVGYIKAAPNISDLPVDLTLVGALIVSTSIFFSIRRSVGSKGVIPIGVLYVGLMLGVMPTGNSTVYSVTKNWQIVAIIPLCLLGGRVILQTCRARSAWLVGVVILSIIIAGLTVMFPDPAAAESGRLIIENGNAIGSARGVGAGIVVLAVWALCNSKHRFKYLLGAGALILILLMIGSRGPIIAAVVAVSLAALISRQPGKASRLAFTALGAAGVGMLTMVQADRLSGRLFKVSGDSLDVRLALWSETLRIASKNPLGIGWGQLHYHIRSNFGIVSGDRQYPHNLLLEIFSEAGWAGGIVFLGVAGYAIYVQWRNATNPVETAMLALLVFALISAMVSGDVPSNREVWVAVGASMACSSMPKNPQAS